MNKECNNCGNKEIKIIPSVVMVGFYAECTKCGSCGCSCSTEKRAIEDWDEMQAELRENQ